MSSIFNLVFSVPPSLAASCKCSLPLESIVCTQTWAVSVLESLKVGALEVDICKVEFGAVVPLIFN